MQRAYQNNRTNRFVLIIQMSPLSVDQLPSNCPDTRFTCTNNNCVTGNSLCDGNDDCGDKSDETIGCKGRLNCITNSRLKGKYINLNTLFYLHHIYPIFMLLECS